MRNLLRRICYRVCLCSKMNTPFPFYYYIHRLINYIINKYHQGIDSYDAVNSFFGLIKERLEKNPNFLIPIQDKVLMTINF